MINEILKNTKGKRLYSRFGKFYKVDELNFNHLANGTIKDDVQLAASQQTAIDPFTMQEVPVTETQVVMFYPENQKRQPKSSPFAYELINYKQTGFYTYLDKNQEIKKILQNHFNALFNKSALQIKEQEFKAKKNKGIQNFTTEELTKSDINQMTDFDTLPPYIPDDVFNQLAIDFNNIQIIN